jgi:hypothetical protein
MLLLDINGRCTRPFSCQAEAKSTSAHSVPVSLNLHRNHRRNHLHHAHQHQVLSVQPERCAGGQLQVGLGVICVDSVGKTHQPPTGDAGSVPAENAQTLELDRRGGTVAAMQAACAAKFGAGSKLAHARNVGPGARLDTDRSGAVQVALGFAQEQLAGEYRDDLAC